MPLFEPLPTPAPIHSAWCPYQRGDSTQALVLPWLARKLGQTSASLDIVRDAHGRPSLIGCTQHVDVNWSHSGQRLLLAVGHGVRLGVDLEYQRPRHNALALAERFFAPAETAQLRALDTSVRDTAFIRLWCAKEAVLKAHGQGISYGLHRLVFALESDQWQLIHCEGELAHAQEWQVHSFTPQSGYLAAVAWREDDHSHTKKNCMQKRA